MNQWKSAHAVPTEARTLDDAMKGADIFLGVSVKGAVSQAMVESMADQPIIFAMANPDPEITPEDAVAVREDAIMATGRSDYPNQVNNVLGFPYIFRGALDVRATTINDPMKIAAAEAIAALAREDVPDEVAAALYRHAPAVRPRLHHPDAVRSAPDQPRASSRCAGRHGQRRRAPADIIDMEDYELQLAGRLSRVAGRMNEVFTQGPRAPSQGRFCRRRRRKDHPRCRAVA